MVSVTTQPPVNELNSLAENIYTICKSTPSLTPRSRRAIMAAFRRNDIALAYDGATMVGWLLATPYSTSVQEIGMAYIKPEYRNNGILNLMVEPLIAKKPVTLAITYEQRLADSLMTQWSFKKSSLREVTICSNGQFILRRLATAPSAVAVSRHLVHAKPIYLISGDKK